ncbi:Reticulon-like protein B8 [Morella rubra]|uniref:Reticulon-like protein n=1 Tax=Morella rubra TaxID=262757 RepID=A0A6A1VCX6_9ROSI|nr:Reticulon-like protein B8 [Morella rubra]
MSEKTTAENYLDRIVETLVDTASKQKSVSFFGEEKSNAVSSQFNRLFGRQKPVHHILGGGKSADVLLWRNKKISAGVLTAATAIWVLFEWLNYHFLTLVFFALLLGMLVQFIWSNASGLFNRSQSKVPHLVLPKDMFVNVAISIGAEVNRALGFLQDVACGGNIKQFLVVVASLCAAAVIGSWCNFMTVLKLNEARRFKYGEKSLRPPNYGVNVTLRVQTIKFFTLSLRTIKIHQCFVAAHTLPVLYERYEDQVDSFVYSVIGKVQNHYQKLDTDLLSKIPKGKVMAKKSE